MRPQNIRAYEISRTTPKTHSQQPFAANNAPLISEYSYIPILVAGFRGNEPRKREQNRYIWYTKEIQKVPKQTPSRYILCNKYSRLDANINNYPQFWIKLAFFAQACY
jgi:hypothetical protein